MSAKNCDKHNRWRSITIGFRVSPEESYALDMRVLTSGLTKQDYCTKKVLDIKQMDELLRDMTVDNANGFLRENNNIRLLELPEGDSIKDEYVQQLD